MTGRVNLVTSTEQEFGTDSNPVVVKSPTGSSIATLAEQEAQTTLLQSIDGKVLTDEELRASPIGTKIIDGRNLSNDSFSATFTPIGELLQQEPIRLVGQSFVGTTLDSTWTTSGILGSGALTLSGDSSATLSTGTTANSAIVLSTQKAARFMFGHVNTLRSVISTPDAGTANNVRRIGADNGNDGLGFVISGTSFGVYYNNNGVITDILSGFNGNLGTTYAWSTTPKALEVVYFTAGFWFFVDGELLHTIALSTLSAPLTRNLSVQLRISNTNSGGSSTNVSLKVWNASIFRLGNSKQRPNYIHINTNSTNVLKRSSGTLKRVVINTSGGTSNTLTLYDNTSAAAPVIATINTTATGGAFEFDLDFSSGLTAVLATGTAADLTIVYD